MLLLHASHVGLVLPIFKCVKINSMLWRTVNYLTFEDKDGLNSI